MLYRPLFVTGDLSDNPKVIWGFRELNLSIKEIITRIGDGEYSDVQSVDMRTLLGKYRNESPKRFVHDVLDVVKEQNPVTLSEEALSDNGEDIGDVDVLVLDRTNNRICIIECKDISSGRNTKEIASEIKNLFDGEKSYLRKHLKRVAYFENKREIISKRFNVDPNYKLLHCFVVSETFPAMLLHQKEVRFVTYLELLKNSGIFSILIDK